MPSNNADKLHFRFSYDVLIAASIKKEAFLRRDQADLNDRGITVERLDAFEALRNAFLEVPSDTTQIQVQTKATKKRDKKANELRKQIKEVLLIAASAVGKSTYAYKSFNIKKLSKLSANDLYVDSENVILQCANYGTEMAAKGLRPYMVTNIATLRNDLLPLIKEAPVAVGKGTATTGKRHAAANALFDEMQAMCQVGNAYYYFKNPLKAKDYLLYDQPAKILKRSGSVLPNKIVAPKTKGIGSNTPLHIKVATGTSLTLYFGWAKGSQPGTKTLTVEANPNIFVTATPADLGFDEATGTTTLNIYNPNAGASAFVLKMG